MEPLPRIAVVWVTHLGDGLALTPMLGAVLGVLARGRPRLVARYLVAGAAATLALVAAKIVGAGLPAVTGASSISLSGHVFLAVVAYGSAAFLLARAERGWARTAVIVLMVASILLVAGSRVYLGHHTVLEVVAGGFAGAVFLMACGVTRLRKSEHVLRVLAAGYFMAFVVAGLLVHARPDGGPMVGLEWPLHKIGAHLGEFAIALFRKF